jgi:hypothetical protein
VAFSRIFGIAEIYLNDVVNELAFKKLTNQIPDFRFNLKIPQAIIQNNDTESPRDRPLEQRVLILVIESPMIINLKAGRELHNKCCGYVSAYQVVMEFNRIVGFRNSTYHILERYMLFPLCVSHNYNIEDKVIQKINEKQRR